MIVWEKTKGFSAPNTSLNLGKESEVSCDTQSIRSPATRQVKWKTLNHKERGDGAYLINDSGLEAWCSE